MDAGRRLKTLRLETKDFTIHINSSTHSVSISLGCIFYRMARRGPGVTCTGSELHYKTGRLSWENWSFIIGSKYRYLLLWREMLSHSYKNVCYLIMFEEIVWKKVIQYCCLKDMQKCERPMENGLPIYFGYKTCIISHYTTLTLWQISPQENMLEWFAIGMEAFL